ncbi:MAG TPA: lipoprotein-releasing ABC transporter permease subunit [Gammaproteobacteria bacterium]|nr:lipoprotein-releasing ABC transporter permease subunit [Gammaproteobacteria bacterium]
MFRPLPVYIGARYTRARRRNHFVSFISATSVLGVALGVAALIVVLSVMNGFERELHRRILGVLAHATVFRRVHVISDWPALTERLSRLPHVTGAAPFIRSAAMITHAGSVNGIVIYGIMPGMEERVSVIGDHLTQGRLADLTPGSRRLILGRALAEKLHARVGDSLNVVAPQPGSSPDEIIPELQRYTVAGIFDVGMYEFDSTLALMHLDDAAALFHMGRGVSGVRLRFDDALAAPVLKDAVSQALGDDYIVADWTQFYVNFFKALKSQKSMMFIIVLLIVLVAAFNIVSMLVMVVRDKLADIAILRTLGLARRRVMMVFITQGMIIGGAGALAGGLGGIYLARHIQDIAHGIEESLHMRFLPPDVYFLSRVPSDIHGLDVTVIVITALVLCLLAAIYPAWRAAASPPAEALRYE